MTAGGAAQVPTLRDYQSKAVADIRGAYRRGAKAPLFVLPTGGGKTVVFAHIAAASAYKGKKTLILVHRVELLHQTAQKLRMFGVRVGLVSPKYTPDLFAPVQVAMVQTMRSRTHLYRHFDLVVTDECHHVVASTYMQVISAYPNAYQLGVTATPVRADGKGLGIQAGGVYDCMVLGPSVAELIRMGHLVEPIVYAPPSGLDLFGVKTRMGDYNRKQLAERVDKRTITGNAVDHYRNLCPGQPAVAFCVSVKHAEHVAAEFSAAGYRAYSVDGQTDDRIRENILAGLGNGQVDVVCSCDIISEGTDIPSIAAAILLRPTQSVGLFLQQVGRALRPAPGKDRALILDHVGNVIDSQGNMNHGFPDMDREWSLDGEIKRPRKKGEEEKGPPIAQCMNCYSVFRAHLRVCPECGTVREIQYATIEQKEGELVEITAEDKARIAREKRLEVGKARTLEQLHEIARQRGYKPGWARHVYNSRKK